MKRSTSSSVFPIPRSSFREPRHSLQNRESGSEDKLATLNNLSSEHRLALEMASQEDLERRALEGELELLEEAWREAEEIAAISDNMFVPRAVLDALAHLKDRVLR